MPDSVIWKPNFSGSYTVESYYNLQRRIGAKVTWDSIVWSPQIPPKYSFCHWLLRRKALKTRTLLARRGMTIDVICPLCCLQGEDYSHLFFQCNYSRSVWQIVLSNLGAQHSPGGWEEEVRWIQRNARGRNIRAVKIKNALACTIYCIWQERNLKVFQHKTRDSNTLAIVIVQFYSMLNRD